MIWAWQRCQVVRISRIFYGKLSDYGQYDFRPEIPGFADLELAQIILALSYTLTHALSYTCTYFRLLHVARHMNLSSTPKVYYRDRIPLPVLCMRACMFVNRVVHVRTCSLVQCIASRSGEIATSMLCGARPAAAGAMYSIINRPRAGDIATELAELSASRAELSWVVIVNVHLLNFCSDFELRGVLL